MTTPNRNNADGLLPRCKCGSSASVELAPRTRRLASWNVCHVCLEALLTQMLAEAGECASCGHSLLLHAKVGCRTPNCRCKERPQ